VSLHAVLKKRFAIFKDLFGQDFGILQCSFLFCTAFHTFCIGEGTAVSAFITRGVSHWGLAIYIKMYLKAKENLWKLKYFIIQKYINLQKILSNFQNPSRCYNSIANLKFQHKPKYHLSKFLYKNRPIF
jgi:hypothetical protein